MNGADSSAKACTQPGAGAGVTSASAPSASPGAVERRLGVVGIVVERRKETAPLVNQLLTEFGDIIVGRMGVPYREVGVSVIALIVDGTTDEIGALTGRLGQIPGVTVKSALTRYSHPAGARERTPGARSRVS